MAKELIHFDQGRVSWSYAVSQVARILNPLGEAAAITANIGACVVEIGQLKIEAIRLERSHQVIDTILRQRGDAILRLYEAEKSKSHEAHLSGNSLRGAIDAITRESCNMRISEDERTLTKGLLPVLAGNIVAFHANSRSELIKLSQVLMLDNTNIMVGSIKALYRA